MSWSHDSSTIAAHIRVYSVVKRTVGKNASFLAVARLEMGPPIAQLRSMDRQDMRPRGQWARDVQSASQHGYRCRERHGQKHEVATQPEPRVPETSTVRCM